MLREVKPPSVQEANILEEWLPISPPSTRSDADVPETPKDDDFQSSERRFVSEGHESQASVRLPKAHSFGSLVSLRASVASVSTNTSSSGDKATSSRCCCLFPRSKTVQDFHQTIVIVRHSIRLDFEGEGGVDAYRASIDGQKFPFDTPITKEGVELAQSVAFEMAELNKSADFVMISCSPYRRCMQTAAEIAKVLRLPILLDEEIGEVWDASMPSDRPPHRSPAELMAMCEEIAIDVNNPRLDDGSLKLFGKPPSWPETVDQGYNRFLVRMRTYIDESRRLKQNYIIVSHAPAVGAMMEVLNRNLCKIDKLEYCARVIASRTCSDREVDKKTYQVIWNVDHKGMDLSMNIHADENEHLKAVNQIDRDAKKRQLNRTNTDMKFKCALRGL